MRSAVANTGAVEGWGIVRQHRHACVPSQLHLHRHGDGRTAGFRRVEFPAPLPTPILERVAQRDEAAVKECLDRYGALVWSLARRLCSDPHEAEDAVQEIFVEVWRSAARYDAGSGSEATFIATIARRRLIDRLRRASRTPASNVLEESSHPSVTPSAEAALDVQRAARALETLGPDQRRSVELSIVGGLSHQQVADQTGLPLGTVKTHIRRGLIRIRAQLAGSLSSVGEPS